MRHERCSSLKEQSMEAAHGSRFSDGGASMGEGSDPSIAASIRKLARMEQSRDADLMSARRNGSRAKERPEARCVQLRLLNTQKLMDQEEQRLQQIHMEYGRLKQQAMMRLEAASIQAHARRRAMVEAERVRCEQRLAHARFRKAASSLCMSVLMGFLFLSVAGLAGFVYQDSVEASRLQQHQNAASLRQKALLAQLKRDHQKLKKLAVFREAPARRDHEAPVKKGKLRCPVRPGAASLFQGIWRAGIGR